MISSEDFERELLEYNERSGNRLNFKKYENDGNGENFKTFKISQINISDYINNKQFCYEQVMSDIFAHYLSNTIEYRKFYICPLCNESDFNTEYKAVLINGKISKED